MTFDFTHQEQVYVHSIAHVITSFPYWEIIQGLIVEFLLTQNADCWQNLTCELSHHYTLCFWYQMTQCYEEYFSFAQSLSSQQGFHNLRTSTEYTQPVTTPETCCTRCKEVWNYWRWDKHKPTTFYLSDLHARYNKLWCFCKTWKHTQAIMICNQVNWLE